MSLQEIIAEVETLSPQEVQALQAYLQTKVAQKAILVGDLVGHLAGCLDDRRSKLAPTVYELGGKLLDGVEGLPPDLSTNPSLVKKGG